MKTHIILLLASLAVAAQGQHTLTGSVTDAETNSPLPGVTMYLPDLKKGSITDDAGVVTIGGLPKGKFLIEFKLIGYTAQVQTVQVDGATELNINLTSMATELHEVVVTGISHTTELRKNPIPLTTLSNQFMTENTSSNLI